MFEVDLPELATEAKEIVQAKVTAIVPQWNKDHSVIHTYIRLNILDDLIGDDEDNEIIVKVIGGTIGTQSLTIEGSARYQVGEENVLFLFQDPLNLTLYQTIGMYQGKYSVFTDAGNVKRVVRDTAAAKATLYKKSGATGPAETGNHYTLEDFKAKILEYRKSENK